MKIVVTGSSGFIGYHLCNSLVNDGYEVIVFDNLSTGNQKNINKNAKFFLVDIAHQPYFEDKKMDDIVSGVDVIFHMAALARIQLIPAEPEVGKIYTGTIANIMDFGAFVTIMPGKDGLVHISEISEERVEDISSFFVEGEEVKVKVLEVDKQGKIRLTMKGLED